VVLGENIAFLIFSLETLADFMWQTELLTKPKRHCHQERTKTLWCRTEIGLEQSLKFQKGLFVEPDIIELVGLNSRLRQTVFNGVYGKLVIVLDASEPFFLRSGNNLPVNYQGSSGIVIKGGYSENRGHIASVDNIDSPSSALNMEAAAC